eukprot:1686694-Rhodomonas_salina.1
MSDRCLANAETRMQTCNSQCCKHTRQQNNDDARTQQQSTSIAFARAFAQHRLSEARSPATVPPFSLRQFDQDWMRHLFKTLRAGVSVA